MARSGKQYHAMKMAVIRSYTSQQPVAVFREKTAEEMLALAAKLGISIPRPVVVKLKHERKPQILYEYIDDGGF